MFKDKNSIYYARRVQVQNNIKKINLNACPRNFGCQTAYSVTINRKRKKYGRGKKQKLGKRY